MKQVFGRRAARASLAVLAVGLLASGCDWYQLGGSSQHNGDDAFDTAITPANVPTLTAHFSASDGTTGAVTPQAVVNGVLYASNASGVEAYSATGTTRCSGSPTACSPLWSYATGALSGSIAIANGVLYASTSSGLESFDAAGQTNCSGAPVLCQPLWSASGSFGTPTVSNNTVYVTVLSGLEAFDATGQTNCSGAPKVCTPIWISPLTDAGGSIATISAGIAYVANGVSIVALDAAGIRGCSGTPKVCAALWSYQTNYSFGDAYPVVSGSTLYIDTAEARGTVILGDVEAFDATGSNGCHGTPTMCSPVWSSSDSYLSLTPPIVGDNAVFEPPPRSGFAFWVFAASGSTNPLWTSSVPANPVAIGGSVVYATNGSRVYAFDAGGTSGCSGSPLVCAPLWSTSGSDSIIANGTVYVSTTGTSGNGEIVADVLP